MTHTDLMTDAEFATLQAEHGPNYPCWEWADRWLKAWHAAHPEEERDDLDIILSHDYPDALFVGGDEEAA